jgi:hypothetical protein
VNEVATSIVSLSKARSAKFAAFKNGNSVAIPTKGDDQ